MLLSCSAKKVTKEGGIGEALSVALPRAKDTLSYVPLPSRIAGGDSILLYILFRKKVSRLFPGRVSAQ